MKIYETKFYMVCLETQCVDTNRTFKTASACINAAIGRKKETGRNYTYKRGREILRYINVWFVPELTEKQARGEGEYRIFEAAPNYKPGSPFRFGVAFWHYSSRRADGTYPDESGLVLYEPEETRETAKLMAALLNRFDDKFFVENEDDPNGVTLYDRMIDTGWIDPKAPN